MKSKKKTKSPERKLAEKASKLYGFDLVRINFWAMNLVQTGLEKDRLAALKTIVEGF